MVVDMCHYCMTEVIMLALLLPDTEGAVGGDGVGAAARYGGSFAAGCCT